MSHYTYYSKRYEIPDLSLKTERISYKTDICDEKLYQSNNFKSVASSRNEDLTTRKEKTKSSYGEPLRNTTDNNLTLTDLLGKSYKFFQPRTKKQKVSQLKRSMYEEFSFKNDKKYQRFECLTNSTWSELRSPLKSSRQFEAKKNSHFQQRQKIWYSSKSNQNDSPVIEPKSFQSLNSPSKFKRKNTFQFTTSSFDDEQLLQKASTEFGSPTNFSQTSIRSFNPQNDLKIPQQTLKCPSLSNFIVLKHLGQGRFGTVSMAIHKSTGLLVALKKVKKSVIKANKLENQFIMQMKMQLFLDHPNILKLYGYFDDDENIYLILEFMEEGTLYSKLKKIKQFKEKQAAQKMEDVLHAVKYMHQRQIVHRDIKPQNIVMSNGVCKLCDFGWAAICENRRVTLCGTIDYAPPEVLEGKQYDSSIDLWCLGVLSYQLLVGKAPFYHISKKQTMQKIIKADISDLKIPQQLSKQSVNFMNKLLIKNPQQRLEAEEALSHEFILKHMDKQNEKLRHKHK